MNNKTKQYASAIMVIGALLILAGCYQAYNPVLAVSAHDDSDDVKKLMAITTFEVEPIPRMPPCTAPDGIGFGDIDGDGYVTTDDGLYVAMYVTHGSDEYPLTEDQKIRSDVNLDGITLYDGIVISKYATYVEGCDTFIACSPPDPARIDDATDTLTTDKSTYNAGDVVRMTATGTNIGDENWHGSIMFYSTDPNGYIKEVYEYELDVAAGATESRDGVMTLPTSAVTGTWSIQSKWIDESGTVHAMTTIDLGTEEIFGIPTMAILMVLLGILVLIAGFSRRRE